MAAHDLPSDPTIITPVSRLLGSTDLGRTAAFYRDVEKDNAIKMRMFEVRDPDGHAPWFGQSYAASAESPALGLLERTMPEPFE